MVASMFSLVLFLQLSRFFSSSMGVKYKICGDDHIVFSTSYGDELFYLNGNLVDKVFFCKTIQLHHADQRKAVIEKTEIGNDRNDHNSNQKLTKEYPDLTIIMMVAAGVLLTSSPLEMIIHSLRETIPNTLLRVPHNPSLLPMSPKLGRIGSVHLNMTEVGRATCNFSPELRIGEGGFGTVYKAQLDSGQFVAIKRAKKEHLQKLQTEFSSEVELLTNIDHRNLVNLLGYVELEMNGLLLQNMYPMAHSEIIWMRGKILDFNQRLEIAIDVAHGLTYLHLYAGKQIIHRDVKSSNILLTESMRAKVADFGFARVGPGDYDQTHISTKLKGTVGYLDPEYMKTYHLTAKSDVYSFGVVLLEILTGRRPAFRMYNEGHIVELVDGMMEEEVDAEILMKIFALAFQCAAPTRNDRPQMKSVAEQLWAIRADYLKTARRGYTMHERE
ncbi:sucrose-phosphate synthase family protein [Hibiscus syriacus]|uniref:Sucrose-phosphate synthase family protein n=1 Tax=Hibiscus syriacus TaxID=106335 RepID=A0A6A2ZAU4_HIBSY|nr:sucrose-phosphate synthase family protein [Hibiscus syriacus]